MDLPLFQCAACGALVPRAGDAQHGAVAFTPHPMVAQASTFSIPCRVPRVEIRRQLDALRVPVHLHDGLVAYLVDRRPTGQFLRAVLENNLVEAVMRADPASLAGLRPLLLFLVNQATSTCWGSPTLVAAWLEDPRGPRFVVEPMDMDHHGRPSQPA